MKIKLGDAVKVCGGYAFKSSNFVSDGVPIVRISNLTEGNVDLSGAARVPKEKLGRGSKFRVYPGDILMAMSGATTGKIGVVPFDIESELYLNQRVGNFRIQDENKICREYLLHYLKSDSYQRFLWNLAAGAAQPNISSKQLESAIVPLPPIPEQKRIAEILDLADEARRKRRENLKLYDDLIRSLFLKTFGDPVSNPMGWDVKEIGEIADVSTGKTPSRARPEYYEGNVPWVKTTEVDGALILETSESISEDAVVQCSMKIFPVNSILIAMYGQGKTRGQSARLGISATTNQACGVILPSKEYCTGYLETYLQINYEAIRKLGRGGNQPNLNLSLVRSIKVLYPSLDMQEKFAVQVEEINAQKSREQALTDQHDDLFNALLQRAFKGEL